MLGRTRIVCVLCMVFAAGLFSQAASGQAAASDTTQTQRREPKPTANLGVVTFHVTDFETGFSVLASIYIEGAEEGQYAPQTFSTNEFGRLRLELVPGFYLEEVTAPGYEPLRSYFQAAPGFPQNSGAVLNPVKPPPELAPGVIESNLRPGYTLVYGFISDSATGRPLAGVHVRSEKVGINATTNERGYFETSVPSPPAELIKGVPWPGLPGVDDITFERPGYTKDVEMNVDLISGMDSGWTLELHRGTGVEKHDDMHKVRRAALGIKEEPQSTEPGSPLPSRVQKRIHDWIYRPGKAVSVREESRPAVLAGHGGLR